MVADLYLAGVSMRRLKGGPAFWGGVDLPYPFLMLDDVPLSASWPDETRRSVGCRYRQWELTYSTASAVLSRRVELLRRT